MKFQNIPSLEKMLENSKNFEIEENTPIDQLPTTPFYIQGAPQVYGEANKWPGNERILVWTPEYKNINFLQSFLPENNPLYEEIEKAQTLENHSIFKGTFDHFEKEFQIYGIANNSAKIDVYHPTDSQHQKPVENDNFMENPGLPDEYSGMAFNYNGENHIILPSSKSEAKIEEFAKKSDVYSMIIPENGNSR